MKRLPGWDRPWVWGALFFLLAFAGVWFTRSDYGFAIDEATYLWVAREERLWFAELPATGWRESLAAEGIAARWHFLEVPYSRPGQPHSNLNLPLGQHVLNFGWLIGHRWLDELTACRLGTLLVFASGVAATVYCLGRWLGWMEGVFSGLFLLFSPRIFGHAHLAATETPLGVFWVGTILALGWHGRAANARQAWFRAMVFGLVAGLAMSVKLTAWFFWPAFALWLVVCRPRHGPSLAAGALASPLVVLFLTPNLWHDPVGRLVAYLRLAMENPWRIPSVYAWNAYEGAPPPGSGLVLFLVTTPVAILVLAALSIFFAPRQPIVRLLLLNGGILLLARCAGWIPTHDGERQFLPLLYFTSILAGIGLAGWSRQIAMRVKRLGIRSATAAGITVVIALLFLAEPARDAWQYRAHALSYFNGSIGGVRGANEMGLEVTYWFESATDLAWRDIMAHLPKGSQVFLRPDHPGIDFLKERGLWRTDVRSVGPDKADFYLLSAKKAAYVLRNPSTNQLEITDLWRAQQSAPAIWEQRFKGVRSLALIAAPRQSNP